MSELWFWGGAHHLINQLAILKKEKSRHAPDLVVAGRTRMKGGVQGGCLDPAQVFPVKPVNQGGQGLARTAGRGVEINHNRQLGLADKGLEFIIRQFDGLGLVPKLQRSSAFTALGMQMLTIGRNPVLTGAGWTGDDKGIHDSVPLVKEFRRAADSARNNGSLGDLCQGGKVGQSSGNRQACKYANGLEKGESNKGIKHRGAKGRSVFVDGQSRAGVPSLADALESPLPGL